MKIQDQNSIVAALDFMRSVLEDLGNNDQHYGPGGIAVHRQVITALETAAAAPGSALFLTTEQHPALAYWLGIHTECNGDESMPELRGMLAALA